MTRERLEELKADCEFALKYEHYIPQPDTKDILALIDAAISAQSRQDEPGEQSDGYHTFNDLYHHRAILFACLSRCYPDKAWKSLKHHDGTMFDGNWFICGIETPQGQYTYHFDTKYWPMFAGKVLDRAPEWDGHKPEDVIRLMSLYPGQSRRVGDAEVQKAIDATELKITLLGKTIGYPYFENRERLGDHEPTVVELQNDLRVQKTILSALSAYRQPVGDDAAKTKFEAWKQGLTIEDLANEKSLSGSCDLCPIYPNVKDPMYPGCGRNSETCYKALTEWGEQDAE